jgi:hypothetical protein
MELPVLNGTIDRRILVNYRIKPEVVKSLLPSHLEPLVINGYASGGICLLRLKNIGVKYSPSFLRITSENAAHRFLVTYRKEGQIIKAVYIPRRDTDSRLNVLLAGKIFSWPHYPAIFQVEEGSDRYLVNMKSRDELKVDVELDNKFPANSMFDSIDHASSCFQGCPVGVSPSTHPGRFKTIELKTKTWNVKPLEVRKLESSFFEDKSLFPDGSICFDNALLMTGIAHSWHTAKS